MRAECYTAQGDYFRAVGDIRPTTKRRNDNTDGYYKLSNLYNMMGRLMSHSRKDTYLLSLCYVLDTKQ